MVSQPDSFSAVDRMSVKELGAEENSLRAREGGDDFFWGRADELRIVEEAFDRNQRGDKCVLFLEGPCGVGKSRLVKEFVRRRSHVSLIAAHYDALRRPEPYVALIPALNDFLATQLSNAELRERIRSSLGSEISVLTPWIPNLAMFANPVESSIETNKRRAISDSSASTKSTSHASDEMAPQQQSETNTTTRGTSSSHTTKRFPYALLLFIRAIASLEQPVVLMVENAQNVDASSVRILHSIHYDLQQCPGLFLAIAFDSEKFADAQNFKMEKAQFDLGSTSSDHSLVEVKLEPLDRAQVKGCISEYLKGCPDEVLMDALLLHSRGNFFLLMELTRNLLRNKGIEADETNGWYLRRQIDSATLVVTDMLQSLSPGALELVKVISCFGGRMKSEMLEILDRHLLPFAQEATECDLIFKIGDAYCIRHHVLHSTIYFDLMDKKEREMMHLRLGKSLLRVLTVSAVEKEIFMVLTHFHFSETILESEEDRLVVAQLCLLAGRRAAAFSTFRVASLHLELAIRLLGDFGWKNHYNLTLACHNAAAEMSMLILDHERTNTLIETVQQKARCHMDRLQAETTQVYALGMADQQQKAIDLGMGLLSRLGERVPGQFGGVRVLWSMVQITWLMRGKTDAELLNLPPMADPKKLMCMQVLNLLFLHAFLARPSILPFVTLKALSLTLEHGLSLIAPMAFSMFGMAKFQLRDFEAAYRFGLVSMRLLEKLGQDESLPRVYLIFYGCLQPLARPDEETRRQHLKAYNIGLQTGDYEFACLNANVYLSKSFDSNCSLENVGKDWFRMRSVMELLGQKTMMGVMEPMIQIIRRLLGQSNEGSERRYDAERAFQSAMDNRNENLAIDISVHELVICIIWNDFQASRKHVGRLRTRFAADRPVDIELTSTFLAVASLELASRHLFSRRKAIKFSRRTIRILKCLSLRCPANFLHTRLFLKAELAAFQGRERQAFESYCGAIATSQNHLMSKAFFTERTARFLAKVNRFEESAEYFVMAHQAYKKWGAFSKATRLEDEFKELNIVID